MAVDIPDKEQDVRIELREYLRSDLRTVLEEHQAELLRSVRKTVVSALQAERKSEARAAEALLQKSSADSQPIISKEQLMARGITAHSLGSVESFRPTSPESQVLPGQVLEQDTCSKAYDNHRRVTYVSAITDEEKPACPSGGAEETLERSSVDSAKRPGKIESTLPTGDAIELKTKKSSTRCSSLTSPSKRRSSVTSMASLVSSLPGFRRFASPASPDSPDEPAMERINSNMYKVGLSKNAQRYEKQLRGAQSALSLDTLENKTVRDRLERMVRSPYFDQAVSMLLMVHAALVGLQVELESEGQEVNFVFSVIDVLFSVIFSLELLARIVVHRCSFFTGDEWQWNVFDTTLVVTLLGEMIISSFIDTDKISTILSILRIGRVVRILRMVRLIPSLKHLVYLIMASVNSFFWAAVLMLMLIYCLAVYFTMQCNSMRAMGEQDEGIVQLWGSLGASTLTMFMAITSGDDWIKLIEGIGRTSPTSQALFYFYVAFASMVMLNLVTGVFVQGASRIISEDKDREFISAAVKAFTKFDTDLSGSITLDEFSQCAHLFADGNNDFSSTELQRMFNLLDSDKSGSLSMLEFIDGCMQMRGTARQFDVRLLHTDFATLLQQFTDMREKVDKCLHMRGTARQFDARLMHGDISSLLQQFMDLRDEIRQARKEDVGDESFEKNLHTWESLV